MEILLNTMPYAEVKKKQLILNLKLITIIMFRLLRSYQDFS